MTASPPRPFVVVISGVPGAGKTTLGWALSRRLHVPFVCRDDIKTGLHVGHESTDPAEVHRFAGQAFALCFAAATALLDNGCPVVVEAAFHREASRASLLELGTGVAAVHVRVCTPPAVSLARYRVRAEAGLRHPAHNDLAFAAAIERGERDVSIYDISLPWPTLDVDAGSARESAGGQAWQWTPGLDEITAFVTAEVASH